MANPQGNPDVPAFKAQQFKPGQPSPNPGGRPKKRITEPYERWADRRLPADTIQKLNRVGYDLPDGATYADAVAAGQFAAAIKGKTEAAKEITDRLEGKATAKIAFTNPEGENLRPPDTEQEVMEQIRTLTARIRARLKEERRAAAEHGGAAKGGPGRRAKKPA